MASSSAAKATRIAKFAALSAPQKQTLLVAAMLMPMFWLRLKATGFSAFSKNPRIGTRDEKTISSLDELRTLGRIVNAAATYTIGPNNCLVRSLVLRHMLARRGIESELVLGVRKINDNLEAHAWIEKDGSPLNDKPDIGKEFSVLDTPLPVSSFR